MRSLFFVLPLWLWMTAAHAEQPIAVIAHPNHDFSGLTRKQIADIYMGRITTLPNDIIPLPVDYLGESTLRERFYQAITGKSMAQVNAYWARMSFTGKANPPRRLADKTSVLQTVEKNHDVLGYVEKEAASKDVATLMVLE